jgi:protein gp37
MSDNSKIEWTNATWNPVRGCTKISPGCTHCYAETFAERFRGVPGNPYEQGFDLRLVPEKLFDPLKWRLPRKIFVNSMSDLFQVGVPNDYIRQVCDVMMQTPQHTYQILTKRHERMRDLLSSPEFADVAQADHVLWGVSAENQKYGLPRVQTLGQTPARHRFISFEPLLEDMGTVDLSGIEWIIIGGESGSGARQFAVEWAESLIMQGRQYGCRVFLKQVGRNPVHQGSPFKIIGQDGKRDMKGTRMEGWP